MIQIQDETKFLGSKHLPLLLHSPRSFLLNSCFLLVIISIKQMFHTTPAMLRSRWANIFRNRPCTIARMQSERSQSLVLRREHVHGNKFYRTKADFGGQERELSIDCRGGDDPRLYFCVDSKRVLKIKHLKWKFRGNERIEVDGVSVQVSWDVHNWLSEDDEEGYALFTFRFDKKGFVDEDNYFNNLHNNGFVGVIHTTK
ncbi:hypothetical protein LIER_32542 [Lithospermum erythrorhizon]|uniref:Uncharacterized protein n=1 Tax=Lithospermum erythrorhizon TaxID=34254 RepID=A0AAV3RXS7_LITER